MASIEERLSAVEKRLSEMEGRLASGKSGGDGDTFSPDKLTASWADKTVRKLPKNWKHRDIVGCQYSDLSKEEALDLAGFHEWKAQKGREENPVRMDNNGKPWHERDTFEAKLLRTWARYGGQDTKPAKASAPYGRSGNLASAKHTMPPEPEFSDADEELPF